MYRKTIKTVIFASYPKCQKNTGGNNKCSYINKCNRHREMDKKEVGRNELQQNM